MAEYLKQWVINLGKGVPSTGHDSASEPLPPEAPVRVEGTGPMVEETAGAEEVKEEGRG